MRLFVCVRAVHQVGRREKRGKREENGGRGYVRTCASINKRRAADLTRTHNARQVCRGLVGPTPPPVPGRFRPSNRTFSACSLARTYASPP